jgi:hypothetical protein
MCYQCHEFFEIETGDIDGAFLGQCSDLPRYRFFAGSGNHDARQPVTASQVIGDFCKIATGPPLGFG